MDIELIINNVSDNMVKHKNDTSIPKVFEHVKNFPLYIEMLETVFMGSVRGVKAKDFSIFPNFSFLIVSLNHRGKRIRTMPLCTYRLN